VHLSRGVHLIGVHPRRASLTGVHLIGVRLIGAYLSQAYITYRRASYKVSGLLSLAKPILPKGILVSLGLRDLEDLQLEVHVRDACG
jgi:hypothetical protein